MVAIECVEAGARLNVGGAGVVGWLPLALDYAHCDHGLAARSVLVLIAEIKSTSP